MAMIKYPIFFAALFSASGAWAQTLSPKVLPTTGSYFQAGGVSLSWTLGETATLTLQSGTVMLSQGEQQPEILNPLPLTWLSIDGNLNTQKQAVIAWKVEEHDVKGYTVEKQTAAGAYAGIGTVASAGDGSHTYSFTEVTPLNGAGTYRIKQVDNNGNYTYSKVVLLKNNANARVWIYPNPAASTTRLYVTDLSLINIPAKLIDMHGRVLQQFTVQSINDINLFGYSQGTYMLQFSNGTTLQLIKCSQ